MSRSRSTPVIGMRSSLTNRPLDDDADLLPDALFVQDARSWSGDSEFSSFR